MSRSFHWHCARRPRRAHFICESGSLLYARLHNRRTARHELFSIFASRRPGARRAPFPPTLRRPDRPYKLDKRFIRKGGSQIWGHVSISLLDARYQTAPLVIGMVQDISEKKATEEQLRTSERSLRDVASRLMQAQEIERQRIGRELHDDIGQRFALLTIQLERLHQDLLKAGQEAHSCTALRLCKSAEELATDIHELSHELHSSKLRHLGLPAALKELARKTSSQQGLRVDFHAGALPKNLSPELALCLFRVGQEALSNVIKYSRTHTVEINVTRTNGRIVLKIKDFGIGFEPEVSSSGIGLSTMRERLRMFGGNLLVNSSPGKGQRSSPK